MEIIKHFALATAGFNGVNSLVTTPAGKNVVLKPCGRTLVEGNVPQLVGFMFLEALFQQLIYTSQFRQDAIILKLAGEAELAGTTFHRMIFKLQLSIHEVNITRRLKTYTVIWTNLETALKSYLVPPVTSSRLEFIDYFCRATFVGGVLVLCIDIDYGIVRRPIRLLAHKAPN